MASELLWRDTTTGSTLYTTIRSAARTYWNGSALEALAVANWGTYDIALTETPASSYFYVGTWPAALTTAGWYWLDVFQQVGASPAISDTLLGTLVVYWDGTTARPWVADANVLWVTGTLQTAGDLGSGVAAILADTGTDGVVVAAGSKAGYSLTGAGLDAVVVETGLNARQALSLNAAALAGVLSGAGTTTITIKAANVPGTTRISATCDAVGNRTAITLTPPA